MPTTRPVALVTGASSGIGEAAALSLAEAGFEVIGTSRKASRVKHSGSVTFLDLDVTSDASVTAAVGEVIERAGRIDVLVNNAGVGSSGADEENSVALARRVFDINVFGVMRMTKTVLPYMRTQGRGRVINISSVLGVVPQPFMAAYAASKHAVEGYSESLDHEVRAYGVRVLLVQPAGTNTAFDAKALKADLPSQAYAEQRHIADQVAAELGSNGDDPAVVAMTIVAAATDSKPKLRYAAGPNARRITTARRFMPARAFDQQIRKANRLAG